MIRAGDTVHHKPSGEDWIVALDEHQGRIYWCGWPFGGFGQAEDCEVKEKATDEERKAILQKVINTKKEGMANRAKAQLEQS